MSVRSGFQPSVVITKPDYLFGHKGSGGKLDQLLTQLLLGTNTQLLGERRSGKTSLLRCISAQVQTQNANLIPVYLNYREQHLVQGYGNAHRLLLAHVHMAVMNTKIAEIGEPIALHGFKFGNDPNPIAHYEELLKVSDYQVDRLLEEYLLEFLGDFGYGVVLLLDEYEHLMHYTFGGQQGSFFKLRKLSSEPPAIEGRPKPLTYVIAGSTPWNELCDLIGSPELNNIGTVLYVSPLELTHFQEMWHHCLDESSSEVQERMELSQLSVRDVYDLSGGWPFYGKVIGHQIASGSYDFFGALVQHFNVIWSRLSKETQSYLKQAERGIFQQKDAVVQNLVRRGLMEISPEGQTYPRGELWRKFVGVVQSDSSRNQPDHTTADSEVDYKLRLIVEGIAILVTEVNETSLNYNRGEVFVCSNQDVHTFKDLQKPAMNADGFSIFTLSLYNLIFERTSAAKLAKVVSSSGDHIEEQERFRVLENLPKQFRRSYEVVRVVDAVRHHFGKGHLTRLAAFNSSGSGMNVSDVLEKYLGSRAHPRDDQFLELQFGLLQDVTFYLTDLRDYLIENPNKN